MRTHKAVAIAVATLGMMLGGPVAAQAGKESSQQVQVPAGGYLYCVASANSRRAINVVVGALDASGAKVADAPISVSTFRAGSGPYFLEERVAYSGDPQSTVTGSCQAIFQGDVIDTDLKACGCRFGEPCPPCIP